MRTELTIHCPRHSEVVLKTLITDDGYVVGTKPGNWTYEFIGDWVPTDEELLKLGISRQSVAVAKPGPGQEQHFRYHLRCPRPSCGYHNEHGTHVTEQLHLYVMSLYRAGVADAKISDLESWIRKMKRADPDVSVLWVSMCHPGIEGRQRVPNNPIAIADQESRGWVIDEQA